MKATTEQIEELEATMKQQNQILLHISAELEAIKQCDPFDSVFIAYSVENISNMIETLTEQSIDEGCIGCAGPCKVVAAKLQKELDSAIGQLVDSRKRCDHLSTELESQADDNTINDLLLKLSITKEAVVDRNRIIEELKDRNFDDLKELYDLYEDELRGIKADRTSIKSDRDIMFQNHHNTVAKLQDDIKGLEAEKGVLNDRIIDKALESQQLRVTISDLMHENVDLEAELSARKEDSAMLMKVVDTIRAMTEDARTCPQIEHLSIIVRDYLDAPEGPPEPTIDDLYRVTVTYAFLEMP